LSALIVALGLPLTGCQNPSGGNQTPERYTIYFDTRGGTELDPVTADEGTAVPKPADPERSGFVFQGWHSAATGGTKYEWPHTLSADVTMHAQWLADAPAEVPADLPVALSFWVNEDGEILASGGDITISKTGAEGRSVSFTAGVAGAYTGVQWTVTGAPITGGTASSITINAADYPAGKTYLLGVVVTKDGIPYSSAIRFTVAD
jgi:uncharacterized repeat protein (TIGR02543 family)